MMRRVIAFTILLLITLPMFSQIKIAGCFDNYWSEWKMADCKVEGSYSGFIIYDSTDGPWEYYFKFSIDNYTLPDSKQRKKDAKNNVWYEFTGVVEYYICDDYPTAYSLYKAHKGPRFIPAKLENGRPTKKISSRATIKIEAFVDRPKIYNIWFDGVGLGISMNNMHF